MKLASLGLRRPYDLDGVHFVGIRRPYQAPHLCRPGRLCYDDGDRAVCDAGGRHDAPDESCRCGFYAFRPDAPMADHLEPGPGQWELDVLLSGKVVVHEDGYRAERQHVRRMAPPRRCGCQRGTPTMVVMEGRDVSAMCVCCAADAVTGSGAVPVRVGDLERALGVPIERGHLADDWLELLESGLITRQVDPSVPRVLDQPVTLRLRASSGDERTISTDRSDVLGRWLADLLEGGALQGGATFDPVG